MGKVNGDSVLLSAVALIAPGIQGLELGEAHGQIMGGKTAGHILVKNCKDDGQLLVEVVWMLKVDQLGEEGLERGASDGRDAELAKAVVLPILLRRLMRKCHELVQDYCDNHLQARASSALAASKSR